VPVAPNHLYNLLRPQGCVGSLDVKTCLMVPEGGSEVPIHPQYGSGSCVGEEQLER
jgi:hypothetical protein